MKNIPHIDGKFLNEFIEKIHRENNKGMKAVEYVFYLFEINPTKALINDLSSIICMRIYKEILIHLK